MKKIPLSLLLCLAILPCFGQNGMLSLVEDTNLKEFGYLKALTKLDSLIEIHSTIDTLYLARAYVYFQIQDMELFF